MHLPIRILDIGCAKGYLVKMLREKGVDAYGVDISKYAINNAVDEVGGYFHVADVEKDVLPSPNMFFDVCVSMSTFEHLHRKSMSWTLSEIHRVLKPDGLLIINVPSSIINKVKSETEQGHVTMLTRKTWVRLIEKEWFSYDLKLSRLFDATRVKRIAELYVSSHHSFQFTTMHFCLPYGMKTLAKYLMVAKRKLFAPNFSLIFRRTL